MPLRLPPVFSFENNLKFMGSMMDSTVDERMWWLGEMCRLADEKNGEKIKLVLNVRAMKVSFIARDGVRGFIAVSDTDAFLILRPTHLDNVNGDNKIAKPIAAIIARYLRTVKNRRLWVAGGNIASVVAQNLEAQHGLVFGENS